MFSMKTIPRLGWVLWLLFSASCRLFAQKTTLNEDLIKADRQFSLYAYNLAMQTYEQVLKEEPNNGQALAGIGDCYFQLNNPAQSLEWYGKAVLLGNTDADVHLRYGKALLQTGDYGGAKEQFIAYAEKNEKEGKHFASLCEYAEKYASKVPDWLAKNESINTEFADYCPAYWNGKIVYNSSRKDLAPKSRSIEGPATSQNYLLVTQRNPDNGQLQKPQNLRSELQNNRNEGPASFSADGKRVVFCRNNFINGTRQIVETGVNMSLYTADIDINGKWKNIKPFLFNGSDHATGFPALSPDGRTLFFSSNKPGGFGGWDIYVSLYKDGNWMEPRNLGYALNTAGNEVTPYFDGANLYFSSDWHLGLGGLDVFKADIKHLEVTNVANMGIGVNSQRDDYGFIFNSRDNIGYVTSTRQGGRGNEDIWKITKKPNNELVATPTETKTENVRPDGGSNKDATALHVKNKAAQRLYLLVTSKNGLKMQGAEVDLTHCGIKKGLTDNNGHFSFDALNEAVDCNVTIRKPGYQETKVALLKFGTHNVHITLLPESKQSFSGVVYDARTNTPLRGVSVQIQFEDGTTLDTQTNTAGAYVLLIEPGSTYLINYYKIGYITQVSKTFLASGMGKIPGLKLEKESGVEKPMVTVVEKGVSKSINNPNVNVNTKPTASTSSVQQPMKLSAGTSRAPVKSYAIQLAAMPDEPSVSSLSRYQSLTKEGNIYVRKEQKLNKIRLGTYATKAEALAVLKKITAAQTQKDAFLVEEYGAGDTYVVGAKNTAAQKDTPVSKLVSKGGIKPTIFAVQVVRMAAGKAISVSDYSALRGLGNLYSTVENGNSLVRLGVWSEYDAAERVKQEAVKRGFPNAVVVEEKGTSAEIQTFLVSKTPVAAGAPPKKFGEKGVQPAVNSSTERKEITKPYFIRIAALSNPDRFDASSLKDLGSIVKRKAEFSPGITIVLLSGFSTEAAAEKALQKVVGKGYYDAYIMKEEKGRLIRL
jgi:tetratricopeptide (TPR) repeat protein